LEGLENYDCLGIGFMLAEPFRASKQEDPEVRPDLSPK